MLLSDFTAGQLADALDDMRNHPHNTAGMSMLDEATSAYRRLSAELDEAQRRFAAARDLHHRSYTSGSGVYSDAKWQAAVDAAVDLAALLRPLGEHRIERCQRPAGWGTCHLPLDDSGECRSSLGHMDGAM